MLIYGINFQISIVDLPLLGGGNQLTDVNIDDDDPFDELLQMTTTDDSQLPITPSDNSHRVV
jgi:hypothetical protein